MAETFTETVLREYGKMRNFLTPEFKPFLYQQFYQLCINALKNVLKNPDYEREVEEWTSESVRDTYYNSADYLYEYFPGTKDGIDSRYEFREKWEDEIEDPLRNFVEEIIFGFLKEYK